MSTEVAIEGTQFLVNGRPTYEGIDHQGRQIQGLLFNSRMVQAIFDDENPATAVHWRYPDTGAWDPERNTQEFCAMLPVYRHYGLLAVTVGLQGGGAIYTSDVYPYYINSAFAPDGTMKPAHCDRLARVLDAADRAGIVVIVNYFYWRQIARLAGESAIIRAVETATDWLLRSGHRNIIVDVYNEFDAGGELTQSGRIHELIEIVQETTLNGRRLLVGSSTLPRATCAPGPWQARVDLFLPHGNDMWGPGLRRAIQRLRDTEAYRARPRPIVVNEDSIHLTNLEAAVDVYASWGFYAQGYGCGGWDHGRYEWTRHPRESRYEDLSGFQTVPVNWSLNTGHKRAFFYRLAELTQAPALSEIDETL